MFLLKYSKYQKQWLFIYLQKYQNNAKNAKNVFWNFSADSLDSGPISDNLENNP